MLWGFKNINYLGKFIKEMQKLLSSPVDVSSHSKAISRISVLRVLYNLAQGLPSSAGYTFERFLALVFGGKVDTDTLTGIEDVTFPGKPVSIKFLSRSDPRVKGSGSTLAQSSGCEYDEESKTIICPTEPVPVTYYVVIKDGLLLDFKQFVIKDPRRIPLKNGRFRMSVNKFEGVESMGVLDLRTVDTIAKSTMEALNNKFNNLLVELQSLVEEVDDLMYTAKSKKTNKKESQLS